MKRLFSTLTAHNRAILATTFVGTLSLNQHRKPAFAESANDDIKPWDYSLLKHETYTWLRNPLPKDGEAKVLIILNKNVEDWKYKQIFEKLGSKAKFYLVEDPESLGLSKADRKQL